MGDRQDGKAWALLLFMVASFSLCTVRTKSPRELYKSGGKRVQRIWSEYSEGKNKVNCGGINWLGWRAMLTLDTWKGQAIFDYPWPRDSGFEKQYFNFLLFECSKTRFSANLFFFLASRSDKVDQYIHIFSRTGTKRRFQQISWNMKLLSSDLLWDIVVFCTLWFFHKKRKVQFSQPFISVVSQQSRLERGRVPNVISWCLVLDQVISLDLRRWDWTIQGFLLQRTTLHCTKS